MEVLNVNACSLCHNHCFSSLVPALVMLWVDFYQFSSSSVGSPIVLCVDFPCLSSVDCE